jgi:hypothetical protein
MNQTQLWDAIVKSKENLTQPPSFNGAASETLIEQVCFHTLYAHLEELKSIKHTYLHT